jgi:yecA family protein
MSDLGSSSANPLSYDRLSEFFEQNGILSNAAEVHGILTGMIAGGASVEGDDWLLLLSDLIHEGQSFKPAVREHMTEMANDICASMRDPDLGFNLLLPSDHESLLERLTSMINWVQSFLVGFGVNQTNLTGLSDDVREVIDDMVEIAKLDFAVDEDEEGERAYFEVVEYLRISAMLCFNELGRKVGASCTTNKVLH